jgi:hypothetical protein
LRWRLYLNLSLFTVVTLFYKSLKSSEAMKDDASTQPAFSKQVGKEKYFIMGFFGFFFVLIAVGFVSFVLFVRQGISQDALTVIWGGLIFLFAFIGIIAISLVVRYLRGREVGKVSGKPL